MKYTLRLLLVVLLTSVSKLALAQAGNIIGQVKDEKGITVIGANVEVIEGQLKKGGAITDDDGKFPCYFRRYVQCACFLSGIPSF